MKIVRGSWSTVVRQVVAGVIATLVATAAWGVSASAAPVAETLTTTMTATSSLDAMAVDDLGAVTNIFEPYHDVVAAEIASKADGVVVGSAIVKLIEQNGSSPDCAAKVEAFVKPLVDAVHAI